MTELALPRAEAERRIQGQIAKGQEMLDAPIAATQAELREARGRYYSWDEYNTALIRKVFTTPDEAEAYSQTMAFGLGGATVAEDIKHLRQDIRYSLRRLTGIAERLELFDEPAALAEAQTKEDSQEDVARILLGVLDAIADKKFDDKELIREAKILNARLGPTYMSMYGAIPEITTTYPPHVWFPRAVDSAEQALAMASAGQVRHEPTPLLKRPSKRVFIVHGHDFGLTEAVARLVTRLGYEPVILHEKPDRGQTIIEKFEGESPDAAFAVILLSPDDEGRLRAGRGDVQPPLTVRARQNVVWEFGYFTARLGRANVVALVSDEALERPSDLDGLLYVPVRTIDDHGWRVKLAREMQAAGLDVDMNQVD
jgi:predicted nucleotide-binding protein